MGCGMGRWVVCAPQLGAPGVEATPAVGSGERHAVTVLLWQVRRVAGAGLSDIFENKQGKKHTAVTC